MKKNKQSMAKETVYDRCAYIGCYNGKYINGRRLFHFPAETDRRLEMWIERSGNFRLRTWAATSLRKAGLCGDHFDDKSFTNSSRKALRRNVVPRHYTEDLKYRKVARENNKNNEKTVTSEITNDQLDRVRLSPMMFEPVDASNGDTNTSNAFDESSSQSEEYRDNCTANGAVRNKSPSPVVEYIVEELDEILIHENSQIAESPVKEEMESSNDEKIQSRMSSVTNEEFLDEGIDFRNQQSVSPVGCNGYNDGMESIERQDDSMLQLDEENLNFVDTSRISLQNLRRLKGDVFESIDEFLNVQKCTNPVTRAMIKLLLHKTDLPYSEEERDYAISLYKNSSEIFFHLRRIGCKFPSERTVKRWLSEETGTQPSDPLSITSDSPEDVQEIDENIEEYNDEIVEENCLIDNEINYIPELTSVIATTEESIEELNQ